MNKHNILKKVIDVANVLDKKGQTEIASELDKIAADIGRLPDEPGLGGQPRVMRGPDYPEKNLPTFDDPFGKMSPETHAGEYEKEYEGESPPWPKETEFGLTDLVDLAPNKEYVEKLRDFMSSQDYSELSETDQSKLNTVLDVMEGLFDQSEDVKMRVKASK